MESGTMRAQVLHNGAMKYAQVHVTVASPPRLQLSSDKAAVKEGDSIRFTASAPNAPVAISGWRFGNATPCSTGVSCVYSPDSSGTMWVFGTVDGVADSASLAVDVLFECQTADPNDPVVDDLAVRLGMLQLWKLSDAANPDKTKRREQVGIIWRDPITASYGFTAMPNILNGPCRSTVGPGLIPVPQEWIVAQVHTHPFKNLDILPPGCRKSPDGRYNALQFNGLSEVDWIKNVEQERVPDPNNPGGGKKIPEYVIDETHVYRGDPGTPQPERVVQRNWPRDMGCKLF
jgi:hypothetical protein